MNPRPPTKATIRKKTELGNQLPSTAQDGPAALAQPATLTVTVTVTVTRVCQSLGINTVPTKLCFDSPHIGRTNVGRTVNTAQSRAPINPFGAALMITAAKGRGIPNGGSRASHDSKVTTQRY